MKFLEINKSRWVNSVVPAFPMPAQNGPLKWMRDSNKVKKGHAKLAKFGQGKWIHDDSCGSNFQKNTIPQSSPLGMRCCQGGGQVQRQGLPGPLREAGRCGATPGASRWMT